MPEKILYPASYLLKDFIPSDQLMGLDDAIEFLAIDPDHTKVIWTHTGLAMSYRFYILQPISFSLPFLSDISINMGEPERFPSFELSFQSNPIPKFSIHHILISLHATPKILQAYQKVGEAWEPAPGVSGYTLTWETGISADVNGNFDFQVPEITGVLPFMIADSGFIIDLSESSSSSDVADVRWINSDAPGELLEKVPPGFKGLFIQRAFLYYHKPNSGTRLPSFGIQDAAIGSGGFSGSAIVGDEREEPAISEERLNAADFDPAELTGDHIAGFELGGMQIILWHLRVSFMQSIPEGFLLTGLTYLPFAEKWMKFKASAGGPDADFMLEIGGAADAPLISLEHELFVIKADSIAYKLQDEVHYAIITGSIKPKLEGFDWPEMQVDGLSISSEGDISIPGGWLKAPNEITLDFHAFKIGISEIGFGNEGEDPAPKRQWLGFSGSLNLVEGLELKASVEGLKFSWLKESDPDPEIGNDLQVSLTGIAVEFEIPNTLAFKGSVKYEKLTEENNGGTGLTGELFKGNIQLNLMAVRLEIEAELMIGKLKDAEGHEFTTFFIVLGAELPAGLPLGATGTSLYGIKGLAAIHAGPTKTEAQNWYQWYLAAPERNITSIKKWKPIYDEYGFGAGVTIGTMYDDGFTLNMSVMLVVLIPGPVIILEGKANLLKQRSDNKDEEGAFYLLAVLDGRAGTFMLNIDVRYTLEDVITVGAGLEAFFDFNNSENWYIYIGRKEPEAKRIRAEILSLFKASAYFMIDSKSLLTGAGVGLDIRKTFGPVSFSLVARISFDAGIFWKPLQLEGALELYGEIALKIFGIGIELILQLLLEGKVPEPYWIHGKAMIGIKLFWPLPELKLEVEFEWTQPGEIAPVSPFLKSCTFIHHKDSGATWPMMLVAEDLPATAIEEIAIVPVDARPVLTFARPVHNLQRHESGGERFPLLSLTADEVGGKQFVYKLDLLQLQEWNEGEWHNIKNGINTGDDDEFSISKESILNLQETTEPNEPQIQLWRYHALDTADQYRREDYNDHHPACNPRTVQQWKYVDWRGVPANTRYSYDFTYAGLQFVCDEIEGGATPAVYNRPELHVPDHIIHFPEPVYQVAVYLTQESGDVRGTAFYEGTRVREMDKTGPVLTYRAFNPVNSLRIEGRTLIISRIVYMTQRSVVEQLAGTNDNHPRVTEQNTNGELFLKPATWYRLKADTSVVVDGSLSEASATTNYAYFRTDEGPGIHALDGSLEATLDNRELQYKEKPVQQFATYIERTLPVDGAKNFYYGYDMGIQFNEAYVPVMYPVPPKMVIRDRNGKTLEETPGAFMDGFLPLMPFGLLGWLQAKETGECAGREEPETPAPYLNFVLSHPFKPNTLYTSTLVTEGSLGEQNLHKFQFTTSRYPSFTDHILSHYREGRIDAIELPYVASMRVADTAPLNSALNNYSGLVRRFNGSSGALTRYKLLMEVQNASGMLNEASEEVFTVMDKVMTNALRLVDMETRPAPVKFEIFKIPVSRDGKCLLVLESPEPIDWLRLKAVASPGRRININLSFAWNHDQTRAFVFHNTGFLFNSGTYKTSFTFSGNADPLTGMLLRRGEVVHEKVEFKLKL